MLLYISVVITRKGAVRLTVTSPVKSPTCTSRWRSAGARETAAARKADKHLRCSESFAELPKLLVRQRLYGRGVHAEDVT